MVDGRWDVKLIETGTNIPIRYSPERFPAYFLRYYEGLKRRKRKERSNEQHFTASGLTDSRELSAMAHATACKLQLHA
jgi:hypothetical protein